MGWSQNLLVMNKLVNHCADEYSETAQKIRIFFLNLTKTAVAI